MRSDDSPMREQVALYFTVLFPMYIVLIIITTVGTNPEPPHE